VEGRGGLMLFQIKRGILRVGKSTQTAIRESTAPSESGGREGTKRRGKRKKTSFGFRALG